MNLDIDDIANLEKEDLEKIKMAIDITKIFSDIELDRQNQELEKKRYELERERFYAQLEAERQERQARIAKLDAERLKLEKDTRFYPMLSILLSLIAVMGTVIVAIIK